ncbi:MAG: hypothetical protein J6Q69_00990 [Clostridia bacterium]|nr:hypothetical protein [Clostridia bacterium]
MTYQPYVPAQTVMRDNKFMRIFNIISGWCIFSLSFLTLIVSALAWGETGANGAILGGVFAAIFGGILIWPIMIIFWVRGLRFNKANSIFGFILAAILIVAAIGFFDSTEYVEYGYKMSRGSYYYIAESAFSGLAGVYCIMEAALLIASGVIFFMFRKKGTVVEVAAPQYAAPAAPQYAAPAAPQYAAPQYAAPQYAAPAAPQYAAPAAPQYAAPAAPAAPQYEAPAAPAAPAAEAPAAETENA